MSPMTLQAPHVYFAAQAPTNAVRMPNQPARSHSMVRFADDCRAIVVCVEIDGHVADSLLVTLIMEAGIRTMQQTISSWLQIYFVEGISGLSVAEEDFSTLPMVAAA